MSDKAEQLKIKLSRRRILQNLNILYPTPLQLGTLFDSLCYVDPDYELVLYKKDIAYLGAKGWLEFIDEKIGGADSFMRKVVGLTAGGKEIAERTQTDPALEI